MAHPNGGSRPQSKSRASSKVIPFGKYLLLERIAVGGMAEVFLAKSFGIEGFEKIIAIKRILPTMAEDDDFIDMFIDEAKIAGHLTHANIVPIYELGKIGDSHYIAMEYVWGKDTLQIMNRFRKMRKRPPPAMVGFIGSKVCEGLDYAHNKRDRKGNQLGLIHRDVSPQNILVSYEGQVKLIDFGIAKAASRTSKTQAGVLKGKFGYMSPEQVRGLPIDHRSDIFAVGTCLYELLTSERLFLGESDFTTLEKVRNADVQPPSTVTSGVPKKLDDIIMKALAREPEDRWQSAGEMQEALQHFLAEQRPPFGTSKLAAWMKTAFASEMAKEKARLDSYGPVGRPSVLSGSGPQPSSAQAQAETGGRPGGAGPSAGQPEGKPAKSPAAPPRPTPSGGRPVDQATGQMREEEFDSSPEHDEDLDGDSTVVQASPFEETEAQEPAPASSTPQAAHPPAAPDVPAMDDDVDEEPTAIFFSSDELEETDDEAPTRNLGEALQVAQQVSNASSGEAPAQAPQAPQAAPQPPSPSSPPASPSNQPTPPPPPPPAPTPSQGEPQPEPSFPRPPDAPSADGAQAKSASPESDPHGQQRHVPTMEVQSLPDSEAKQAKEQGSTRRTWKLAVAAAAVLGAVLMGGWLFFSAQPTGGLEVRTEPQVAGRVLVDGVPRGRTPLTVTGLKPGERVVEVRAEGFEPVTKQVQIKPDRISVLPALELMPASAGSSPRQERADRSEKTEASEPREHGAGDEAEPEASADDEDSKQASPSDSGDEDEPTQAQEKPPSQDEPTREQRRAQRQREQQEQAAAERRQRQRRAEARRKRAASQASSGSPDTGTLIVNSVPWSRVFVDGRDTGKDTPVRSLELPAGSHQIKLRTSDGEMHGPFQVQVQAGEKTRFGKRL